MQLASKPLKTVDKKNTNQILKEADPDATKEDIDRFMKLIEELMKYFNIVDKDTPQENIRRLLLNEIIDTIRKIESNLNHYAEARNHLVLKQELLPQHQRQQLAEDGKDIIKFEQKQDKIRKDERIAKMKEEQLNKLKENKDK